MYKVTSNFEPPEDQVDGEALLRAEKGDIIINGKILDSTWFQGTNTVTEKTGKIPRENIEAFNVNGGVNTNNDETVDSDSLVFNYNEDEHSNTISSELNFNDSKNNKLDDIIGSSNGDVVHHEVNVVDENYVNMSSSDDTVTPVPKVGDEEDDENIINPVPKPPRINDGKSDEGYNSGSYYSGDANETCQPLLEKSVSKQDEAGYEVPQLSIDITTDKKSNETKSKRKYFRSIFRASRMDASKGANKGDDMSEKYYNPPVDIREHYFLPKSQCPIVRVLLSLVAALAISFTTLFLLLISLNPLLSFCISFVLFIIVFVIPVTLLHKGFACVVALVFPSVFSTRTKIAGTILLVVLLIIGPIIGIGNKLNIASTCMNVPNEVENYRVWSQPGFAGFDRYSTFQNSRFQHKCVGSLKRVRDYCVKMYTEFQKDCLNHYNKKSILDEELCSRSLDEFCLSNTTFVSGCLAHTPEISSTADDVRNVLFYLIPVLALFLFSDAYMYNKIYLTTKNADNVYITQRLKQLDCERKNRGLTDLILPLTRIEFQTYLLRGRSALSKPEKLNMVKWLGLLLLFGFITLCFILVEDRVHAALLNSLVGQCKVLYESNTDVSFRIYIYILLGVFLFVVLLQSYVLRLRSKICDYFYPDMVDIRAKHLYYKILHDRHSFGRHIRRKIQLRAEAKRLTRRISCLNMVYHILPAGLQWVCQKLSVRRCMICDSVTYYKTVVCKEGVCQAHYCYECFVDAGQQCLTCKSPNSPHSAPTTAPPPPTIAAPPPPPAQLAAQLAVQVSTSAPIPVAV